MKIARLMQLFISTMGNGEPVVTMECDNERKYFAYHPEVECWVLFKIVDGRLESQTDYETAKKGLHGALTAAINEIEANESNRGEVVMVLYEVGMVICILDYLNRFASVVRTEDSVKKALAKAHETDADKIINGLKSMAGIEYEFLNESKLSHETFVLGGKG